jgi:hypothetical protein
LEEGEFMVKRGDFFFFANEVLQFETVEWSLTPEGGETVSLLDGTDPFQKEE